MPSQPESAAAAGSALPPLVLKRQEERRLQAGHLWIFSNEVDVAATPLTAFEPGAHVAGAVEQRPLPRLCLRQSAHADQRAPARARPGLSARQVAARAPAQGGAGAAQAVYATPFYRLVYGEGDLLPGLVVDRYGDVLVAQIGTAGMEAMKAEIQEALVKVVAPAAILWKNDSPIRELEGLPRYVETAFGECRIPSRCPRAA